MQAQYETAWTNAESTHAQGRQLLDSLTKVAAHPVLTGLHCVPRSQRACSWPFREPCARLACLQNHNSAGEERSAQGLLRRLDWRELR